MTAVSELLTAAIEASGKTNRQIAEEIGLASVNMVSMMRHGAKNVPLALVPKLAHSLDIETKSLLRAILEQDKPKILAALRDAGLAI